MVERIAADEEEVVAVLADVACGGNRSRARRLLERNGDNLLGDVRERARQVFGGLLLLLPAFVAVPTRDGEDEKQ